jgi:hypothetical protein
MQFLASLALSTATAATWRTMGEGATGQRVKPHLHPHRNCDSLHHFQAAGRACRSLFIAAYGGRAIHKQTRAQAAYRAYYVRFDQRRTWAEL